MYRFSWNFFKVVAAYLLLWDCAFADTTVFVNVTVVPMTTDTVMSEKTVVVSDGVITTIGPVDTVPVPAGAGVIDGTDRYLMPGLAEMHAHITSESGFERLANLFVANGVTTIRGMLGRREHLRIRGEIESGHRFGPRLITSGPSFNNRSVDSPADAARKVNLQAQAGYDFIKIHPGLNADEFAAMANSANKIGIPFAGHVPVAVGVLTALQHGIRTIDHLDGYFGAMMPANSDASGGYGGFFDVMLADQLDIEKMPKLVAATAAAGTWNVPTQTLVEQLVDKSTVSELRNRPEMRYVPASTVSQWVATKQRQLDERGFDPAVAARGIELRRNLVLSLHRASAGLLLGSDAPQIFNVPGFSLHRELGTLVASGLTPYEALQTGTTAVAEFLDSNTGVVAVGKAADLVLLNANPLIDIKNSQRIHGVMLRGEWYSRKDLDSRLARIAEQANK